MFELSVACKYLIPRRRQLSVSIISLISVLVIALVVWLIVVFFSVTDGLEKSWVKKLTALTAPVRITPTDAYYHSYYYQIDSISEASNYSSKTLREKHESSFTDPYNPEIDEEIPAYWPTPDYDATGNLKDLVKLVYASLSEIQQVPGLSSQDFELTASHLRIQLARPTQIVHAHNLYGSTTQSTLSYPAYLGNFEKDNSNLGETLLPVDMPDLNNLLYLMDIAPSDQAEEEKEHSVRFNPDILQKRLNNFFNLVTIKRLKTRSFGWAIPRRLIPQEGTWEVCAIVKDQHVIRLVVPQQKIQLERLQQILEEQGLTVIKGQAFTKEGLLFFQIPGKEIKQLSSTFTLTLAGNADFPAFLEEDSLAKARQIDDLQFWVKIPLQDTLLQGKIFYRGLEIADADIKNKINDVFPLWIHREKWNHQSASFILPKDPDIGEGVILPKSFREAGVLIGDRGSLSYLAPTVSLLQEQQIPIYVAGFYDPGIIPIGGKFILASPEVTSLIRSSHSQEDKTAITNGINVRFDHLDHVNNVKQQLQEAFQAKGIHRYWNVETYREYEFTKEIIQELQSQKNLFMLIAIVIIIVACSNIISMLVILVNDKKTEIGILRSMGASSKSIALIFGSAGAIIGVLGSVIGITGAILTLRYLNLLVAILNHFQGHRMFNANLYGQVLPHELSFEALSFVLGATCCISLLAGIVPAIKACLLRPSHILRASGG